MEVEIMPNFFIQKWIIFIFYINDIVTIILNFSWLVILMQNFKLLDWNGKWNSLLRNSACTLGLLLGKLNINGFEALINEVLAYTTSNFALLHLFSSKSPFLWQQCYALTVHMYYLLTYMLAIPRSHTNRI